MAAHSRDVKILRELATQYAELSAKPVQDERRRLWAAHFSLEDTTPPVLATYGMWNVWCGEVFGDHALGCEDPFYREHERRLRMAIFHDSIGDDFVLEPWLTVGAARRTPDGHSGQPWGVQVRRTGPGVKGGAWKNDPPIKDWADIDKLTPPPHEVDEEQTARRVRKLGDAVGDILEIDVGRGPVLSNFAADISTTVADIRGLEQIMVDMYDSPAELHRLLAFLRDGILANQRQADDAGHYSLTSQHNQAMAYARELEAPAPTPAREDARSCGASWPPRSTRSSRRGSTTSSCCGTSFRSPRTSPCCTTAAARTSPARSTC